MTKVLVKNLLISITPNYTRRFRHLRYFSGWKDLFQHIKADKESSNMNIVTGNHLFLYQDCQNQVIKRMIHGKHSK
tara:strand:- start:466 stop:693 length:228 start_codon:yes stop_codon:yes gene_type:complete